MRATAIVLALTWPLLAGCALPVTVGDTPRELLVGYSALGPEGESMHRIVPGIDLRAFELAGLTVGWSDIRMLRPREEGRVTPPARSGLGFAPPLGLRWTSEEGVVHRFGWTLNELLPAPAGALFLHIILGGVGLESHRYAGGATLGFKSATCLVVPIESDGVFELDYDSRSPGAMKFIRRKDGMP